MYLFVLWKLCYMIEEDTNVTCNHQIDSTIQLQKYISCKLKFIRFYYDESIVKSDQQDEISPELEKPKEQHTRITFLFM